MDAHIEEPLIWQHQAGLPFPSHKSPCPLSVMVIPAAICGSLQFQCCIEGTPLMGALERTKQTTHSGPVLRIWKSSAACVLRADI